MKKFCSILAIVFLVLTFGLVGGMEQERLGVMPGALMLGGSMLGFVASFTIARFLDK